VPAAGAPAGYRNILIRLIEIDVAFRRIWLYVMSAMMMIRSAPAFPFATFPGRTFLGRAFLDVALSGMTLSARTLTGGAVP